MRGFDSCYPCLANLPKNQIKKHKTVKKHWRPKFKKKIRFKLKSYRYEAKLENRKFLPVIVRSLRLRSILLHPFFIRHVTKTQTSYKFFKFKTIGSRFNKRRPKYRLRFRKWKISLRVKRKRNFKKLQIKWLRKRRRSALSFYRRSYNRFIRPYRFRWKRLNKIYRLVSKKVKRKRLIKNPVTENSAEDTEDIENPRISLNFRKRLNIKRKFRGQRFFKKVLFRKRKNYFSKSFKPRKKLKRLFFKKRFIRSLKKNLIFSKSLNYNFYTLLKKFGRSNMGFSVLKFMKFNNKSNRLRIKLINKQKRSRQKKSRKKIYLMKIQTKLKREVQSRVFHESKKSIGFKFRKFKKTILFSFNSSLAYSLNKVAFYYLLAFPTSLYFITTTVNLLSFNNIILGFDNICTPTINLYNHSFRQKLNNRWVGDLHFVKNFKTLPTYKNLDNYKYISLPNFADTILVWGVDSFMWSKSASSSRHSQFVLTPIENQIIGGDILASSSPSSNIYYRKSKIYNLDFYNSNLLFAKSSYPFIRFLQKSNHKSLDFTNSRFFKSVDVKLKNFYKGVKNLKNLKYSFRFRWFVKKKLTKRRLKFKVRKSIQKSIRYLGIKFPKKKRKGKLIWKSYPIKGFFKKGIFFIRKYRRYLRRLKKRFFKTNQKFIWKIPKTHSRFFRSLSVLPKIKRKSLLFEYAKSDLLPPKSSRKRLTMFANKPSFVNFNKKYNFFKGVDVFDCLVKVNPFNLNNHYLLMYFFKNNWFLKLNKYYNYSKFTKKLSPYMDLKDISSFDTLLDSKFNNGSNTSLNYSNILPHFIFKPILAKKVYNVNLQQSLKLNFIPWYYHSIIRFIEDCSGKKVLFQFYPFVSQEISKDFIVRYKRWIPRMAFYERRLGHRFFLEEALHILHIGFFLKDPVIISSWLKSMILRISFWKTRSIFRFLKYLFHNYYRHVFQDIGVRGLKLKLKGKISAAGNSRKRCILYRIGETSHSKVDLKVVHEFQTINTFTGVMGFQVWLFY